MIDKKSLKYSVDSVNSSKGKKAFTIQCSCGTKILIVPDLAAMARAIKNHKATHREADERLLAEQIIKLVGAKEPEQ
jgi:hypothetical protein